MQPSPPEGGWAGLAEGNEAGVYESLVQNARSPGFVASRESGAVALRSPAAPSVLVVNRVIACGALQPPDEALIDRLAALYGDAGFGIELGAPLCTGEVLGWLKARRFRRLTNSQMMVCETSAVKTAGRYDTWARSSGLRVERVGAEQASLVARLCCENFKVPAALGALVQAGTAGAGWRRWLAFDGDRAVGASLSHARDGVGWFGWTSVSPSHRGRWIHAGFVARQFEDAVAAGCRWVTTDTAESTRERPDPVYLNLKRFGFVDAYLRPIFVRAPAHRPG
ncbi:MAG: hypothetical protein HZC37_20825 [Burkholderiales bacterium]|nr:hypothetical protein [Burkholderiales bacterium]